MQQITPTELKDYLEKSDDKPLLLDVREPMEYQFCHMAGSRLIPMGQIPFKIGELDPDQATVVICHHGIRSLQVAHYLSQQGFRNVLNLQGGIDAWAIEVEPTMPRY